MNAARLGEQRKLAVHKNIYVGISGKCHTMLPRFTTAAHLLFDEFMAKLGSLGSLLPEPGGSLLLGALNCFTFDDKLVEDTARACQMANGRRV